MQRLGGLGRGEAQSAWPVARSLGTKGVKRMVKKYRPHVFPFRSSLLSSAWPQANLHSVRLFCHLAALDRPRRYILSHLPIACSLMPRLPDLNAHKVTMDPTTTSSSTDTGSGSKEGSNGGPKAIIKNVDMSEEMQQESVDIASAALEKYNIEKDIAAQIKKEFDRRHGPTWHVVVGKNFGSYVTHGELGCSFTYLLPFGRSFRVSWSPSVLLTNSLSPRYATA